MKLFNMLWGVALFSAGFVLAPVLYYGQNREEPPHVTANRDLDSRKDVFPVAVSHHHTTSNSVEGMEHQKVFKILQCLLERRVKAWPEMKRSQTIHLVFFGRPVMEDMRRISYNRGWKLKQIQNDSLDRLNALISPHRFLIVFSVTQKYSNKVISKLTNSKNALVGTIGNSTKVTGSKRSQLTTFRKYFQKFGCLLEDTDLMPRSFILDNLSECMQFFRYSNEHPTLWWVLKPSKGSGGYGISVHSNLTYIYGKYSSCRRRPDAIIQEYIINPLLIENRKFDIRAYILVARTAPYYLVFYHEGYLRVSIREFDIYGSRDVHITNTHVQISLEEFSNDDHIWSFQEFQSFLNEYRPDDGIGFVSNILAPFMQKVGIFVSHAAKSVFAKATSNFLLIGMDFMVKSDLSVQFIEANTYPVWAKGTKYIHDIMRQMGNDMFDLLFDCRRHPDQFQDMRPGQLYGTWTLIWNELYAECTNAPPYNPCTEFSV